MEQVVRFGVSLPRSLLTRFDKMAHHRRYGNRSEAIRDLLRECLVEEEWEGSERDTVGTVSLVYNHEKRDLDKMLTSLQHQHTNLILATLHIHLDKHNCLEVVVIKGKSNQIRKIADSLISTKGVKYGKLTTATMGENLE